MKKLSKGEVDITDQWRHGLGLTAGLLWHYLGEHGLVPVRQLELDAGQITADALKQLWPPSLKPEWAVYMAIGWLACERKIMMFRNTATGDESICLNQTEQEIYWRMWGDRGK